MGALKEHSQRVGLNASVKIATSFGALHLGSSSLTHPF